MWWTGEGWHNRQPSDRFTRRLHDVRRLVISACECSRMCVTKKSPVTGYDGKSDDCDLVPKSPASAKYEQHDQNHDSRNPKRNEKRRQTSSTRSKNHEPSQHRRHRCPNDLPTHRFGRQQETRSTQQQPYIRIDYVNEIAVGPLRAPWQEEPNTVIVGPIQQRMSRGHEH